MCVGWWKNIVKGKLHVSPSYMRDKIKKETWLVGVDEENTDKFNIEAVPNRKKEDLLCLFKKFIKYETTIKTGGHRSYPATAYRNLRMSYCCKSWKRFKKQRRAFKKFDWKLLVNF